MNKSYGLIVGLLALMWSVTVTAADASSEGQVAVSFDRAALADLEASLDSLMSDNTLVAEVVVTAVHNVGEDDEKITRQGAARVKVVDKNASLSLRYSAKLLQQMAQEATAQTTDSDAPTPTHDGVEELALSGVQPMLRAAHALQQELASADYIGAKSDTYQGNSARKLEFAVGEDRLTKRQRKYVKEYDGVLTVWIDAQGVPLASRTRIDASGRAFIVISFSITMDSDSHYRAHNGRLITTRRADYQLSAGAGERSERLVNKTLEVIDE